MGEALFLGLTLVTYTSVTAPGLAQARRACETAFAAATGTAI